MIKTRLTEKLGLMHPIISAPMAFAAGGKLAASVSQAGGLGLIGGGYGNQEWLEEQFELAGDAPVGCGFITWSLAKQPQLLTQALAHEPDAICLSFGDPTPFVDEIKQVGIPIICQVQTREHAEHAISCGVDVIIAQGSEAGGHGSKRATLTLVPEIADLIASTSPQTLLCAAGGIGDGRGLAASLMLGADGVLMGSRLWASHEASVSKQMHQAALDATGDDTIRTTVMDVMRELSWKEIYTARVLQNPVTDQWHNNIDGLLSQRDKVAQNWIAAWQKGDPKHSNTFVGEATGLIHDIMSTEEIIDEIIMEAEDILTGASSYIMD